MDKIKPLIDTFKRQIFLFLPNIFYNNSDWTIKSDEKDGSYRISNDSSCIFIKIPGQLMAFYTKDKLFSQKIFGDSFIGLSKTALIAKIGNCYTESSNNEREDFVLEYNDFVNNQQIRFIFKNGIVISIYYELLTTVKKSPASLNVDISNFLKNNNINDSQQNLLDGYKNVIIGNISESDRFEMLSQLEKMASDNVLEAQELLCRFYLEMSDFPCAIKWAKKAMLKGSIVGKAAMGYLLYYGEGVITVDRQKAYSIALETISDPIGKALLAHFYFSGWYDLMKDYAKAKELVFDSIKANCSLAFNILDGLYAFSFIDNNKDDVPLIAGKKLLPGMSAQANNILGMRHFPLNNKLKAEFIKRFVLYDDFNIKESEHIVKCLKKLNLGFAYSALYDYEYFFTHDQKKASEYLLKGIQLMDPFCLSYAIRAYSVERNSFWADEVSTYLQGPNKLKAKDCINKLLRTGNPDYIFRLLSERLATSFLEWNYHGCVNEAMGSDLVSDFDIEYYIKQAADNGSAEFAYLYSKNKNLSRRESMKYLKFATFIGVEDALKYFVSNLLKNPDFVEGIAIPHTDAVLEDYIAELTEKLSVYAKEIITTNSSEWRINTNTNLNEPLYLCWNQDHTMQLCVSMKDFRVTSYYCREGTLLDKLGLYNCCKYEKLDILFKFGSLFREIDFDRSVPGLKYINFNKKHSLTFNFNWGRVESLQYSDESEAIKAKENERAHSEKYKDKPAYLYILDS